MSAQVSLNDISVPGSPGPRQLVCLTCPRLSLLPVIIRASGAGFGSRTSIHSHFLPPVVGKCVPLSALATEKGTAELSAFHLVPRVSPPEEEAKCGKSVETS